jgi:hypothetical protein
MVVLYGGFGFCDVCPLSILCVTFSIKYNKTSMHRLIFKHKALARLQINKSIHDDDSSAYRKHTHSKKKQQETTLKNEAFIHPCGQNLGAHAMGVVVTGEGHILCQVPMCRRCRVIRLRLRRRPLPSRPGLKGFVPSKVDLLTLENG